MRRIHFEPDRNKRNRDFDRFIIADDGHIVKTEPYNVPFFRNCQVDLNTLALNKRIEYEHPTLGTCGIKYKVTEIEDLKCLPNEKEPNY